MSFKALQSLEQVARAREELVGRGWSYSNSAMRRLLWRITRGRVPRVGDSVKSWDVLLTAELADERIRRDRPVLDLGAFGSEMPPLLHMAGYQHVYGIDLNPNVRRMPFADSIQYIQGDFHDCPFGASTFDLVTAISTIEHGYAPERLLTEVSRLLAPGGLFVASFDFWPERLRTDHVTVLGLPWLIFSAEDVRSLILSAARYGLLPVDKIDLTTRARPIHFAGFDYTFGWLALRKTSRDQSLDPKKAESLG
jgi:SAM-dependent methyltransferase